MYSSSILPEALKTFDYYLKKLPLFLRQSDTFIEHFRIWYDLLANKSNNLLSIANVSDAMLFLLNIFDDDYLSFINSLDSSAEKNVSDILDKLAALFGVKRSFSVTYLENDEQVAAELDLNNADLLTLIKAEIIKDYCDGTTEQIAGFYQSIGLAVYVITVAAYPGSPTKPNATAHLYLAETVDHKYSDNVKIMFKSGILRISNLGIAYLDGFTEIGNVLIWDAVSSATQGWDTKGVWAE